MSNVNANIVLCRGWNFIRKGNTIAVAEKNFSIPASYFDQVMAQLFPNQEALSFLNTYDERTQGEAIYRKAKEDNKIVEEGENM